MRSYAIHTAIAALTILLTGPASASDCDEIAKKFAKKKGGEVISVQAGTSEDKSACDVAIRVPDKEGKPPRVVTKILKD